MSSVILYVYAALLGVIGMSFIMAGAYAALRIKDVTSITQISERSSFSAELAGHDGHEDTFERLAEASASGHRIGAVLAGAGLLTIAIAAVLAFA